MTRSERRGQHGHARAHHGGHRAPETLSALTTDQAAQLDALRARIPSLAAALRDAADAGRDALTTLLAPIETAEERVALAYADALGDSRGPLARDAADVAEALGELSARKEVGRLARRSRIRLRSAGSLPSLRVPASGVPTTLATPAADDHASGPATPERPTGAPASSEPEPAQDTHTSHTRAPGRIAQAHASRNRETGEMLLLVAWQESATSDYVRPYAFELSFWTQGVKHFSAQELMAPATFRKQMLEPAQDVTPFVAISPAEVRRLLREALDTAAWRGDTLNADYQLHHKEIEERLLTPPDGEPADDDPNAGDRAYIDSEQEPDEVAANWIGAWSFGDYGLAYDLLADDHPSRRKEPRAEYIALRRQWAKEAEPSGLRLTLVREQAQRASALWLPGSAGVITGGERKDVEAFWSLVLRDAPEGGQLDELPMATLTSGETGRHWYWTAYTLNRDRRSGLWLISRTRDEGVTTQALKIEELQERIREAHATVEQITQQTPPDPRGEEAADLLRTLTGAMTAALHYRDALLVRLPLDEAIYRDGITDARSLGNYERSSALLEKLRARFGGSDQRLTFELGVEQYLAAEQAASQGDAHGEAAWLERSVRTLTQVVEAEPTAEHLQGLGELLSRQGHFNQAETRLREAIAADPQRAMVHADLADALMGRISSENLDDPIALSTDEQRDLARQALGELRQAVTLDTTLRGVYTRIGALYEVLEQHDDALIAFDEAIRRDPGDAEAHYTLGTIYMSRRQPENALPHIESAVQLAPGNLAFRIGLATAYVAVGRRQEATREIELLESVAPGLPQIAELRRVLAETGGRR
ncbi:MAG TPA: tetratricopeptide repeat protein [Ktedonobacterales bacterium]|nr:tetratricopeptide repeat protein [Ktedonobacterales bacterium]